MNARVLNNTKWILICRIIQSVLALVVSMLTARYLGPSNFGIVNYAASLVAFVAPIMYVGMNNILVQEFVQKPEQEGVILGSAILTSMCSAFLCIVGIGVFASVANPGEPTTVWVCLLYSLLLLAQSIDIIHYWFQAKLLSKYTAPITLIAYVLISIYKFYLLASGKSVYWFAISNAIEYVIIAIGLLLVYKKLGGKKLKFSWTEAKRMCSVGKYYIVSSMMVAIFAQIDKIMLKAMMDETAVGHYSAAVTCAGITSFVFAAIIDSMRPVILEKKKNVDVGYEQSVANLYSIIIYTALLQCVFMTVLSKPIVLVLYGSEYMPTVSALCIIVWYTTFSYMGSVRNVWILAESKQKCLWMINLSGAVCNIVLNWVFIPIWGINGAAFASLLTQIFTNYFVGFIIKPIRRNNALILWGCNPKRAWNLSMGIVKYIIKKK